MDVAEITAQNTTKWDEYVLSSPLATPFHLSQWRLVFGNILNLQTHYLLASEDDQIRGVLPLLFVRSKLTGRFITSMPGGLCADNQQAASAILEVAKDLVRCNHASFLILRDGYRKWDLPDLVTNEDHCTMVVKLPEDPDAIWKSLDRRVRQSVNRAIKQKIKVVSGPENLDIYYPVYLKAMRDVGTPSLGLRFFKHVFNQFPTMFDILMVRQKHQVLGGGFVAYLGSRLFNTWGGMLREYYRLRPNYLLYWNTLKLGCELGLQSIDLGRCTRGSGNFDFKRRWTAQPQALYQQFLMNGISRPPAVGGGWSKDVRYRLFVALWRGLPLSIVEILGPWLRKRIPFG